MKADEKALELVQKFGYTTMFSEDNEGKTLSLETSKKCALIAVEEILIDELELQGFMHCHNDKLECTESIEYWDVVKSAIKEL